MDLRPKYSGPKYLFFSFFFFPLTNTSWYKWLQWLIFLKGHYISLAYFLTIHITEGCLQLWAKQREYCHPHDQASKETTLLIVTEKRTLCLHKHLYTSQFLAKAWPQFQLLVGSGHASAASTRHPWVIGAWLSCDLTTVASLSSCSEICSSLHSPPSIL